MVKRILNKTKEVLRASKVEILSIRSSIKRVKQKVAARTAREAALPPAWAADLPARYTKPASAPLPHPASTSTSGQAVDSSAAPTYLTHLTSSGEARMVSVASKPVTTRTAIASGFVYFHSPTTLQLLKDNSLKKGDALAVARIAGIAAAKKTSELVPLCHNIFLSGVDVRLGLTKDIASCDGVLIEAKVTTSAPTGVEMEAITAVSVAAITIVDMVKGVDPRVKFGGIRCVYKNGGRTGLYVSPLWIKADALRLFDPVEDGFEVD